MVANRWVPMAACMLTFGRSHVLVRDPFDVADVLVFFLCFFPFHFVPGRLGTWMFACVTVGVGAQEPRGREGRADACVFPAISAVPNPTQPPFRYSSFLPVFPGHSGRGETGGGGKGQPPTHERRRAEDSFEHEGKTGNPSSTPPSFPCGHGGRSPTPRGTEGGTRSSPSTMGFLSYPSIETPTLTRGRREGSKPTTTLPVERTTSK